MPASDLYQADHHWGGQGIDIDRRDLPALKARFLLDALPAAGRVVEVGCGGGRLLKTIAAHRPALELHGCDIRPLAVEPSHFEFTLVAPDDATLPYERESVDCVVLFDVLEHLIDPAKTLGAVHEILRPNGAVISFTPLEAQPLSFYVMFRRLLGDDLYVTTKEHVQAFSERALRTLVEQEFTIRKVEYAYHLVGHFMDAFLFALMKSPWVRRRFWQDNPFYAEDEQQAGELSALGIALRAANAVAYAESSMLRHCRAGAAGMLFVATAR